MSCLHGWNRAKTVGTSQGALMWRLYVLWIFSPQRKVTKTWRGYMSTAICLCVCVCVCLSASEQNSSRTDAPNASAKNEAQSIREWYNCECQHEAQGAKQPSSLARLAWRGTKCLTRLVYIIKEGLSVRVSVCIPLSTHSFGPIGMKLGMNTPWYHWSNKG